MLLFFPFKTFGENDPVSENMRAFSEAIDIIMKYHVEEPDLQELFAAVFKGVNKFIYPEPQIKNPGVVKERLIETNYETEGRILPFKATLNPKIRPQDPTKISPKTSYCKKGWIFCEVMTSENSWNLASGTDTDERHCCDVDHSIQATRQKHWG